MNKKTIGLGIATLAIGMSLATPTTHAFFGGGEREGGHGFMQMTQERFDQIRNLFVQNTSVDTFKTAMEQFRTDHQAEFQAERDARRAEHEAMRDSVTQTVENIDNGVVKTLTSDDADMVAKIQERATEREPKNDDVTHTVELLDNGVKITITSDDADTVEKLQEHEGKRGRGEMERGKGREKGRGFGRMNH